MQAHCVGNEAFSTFHPCVKKRENDERTWEQHRWRSADPRELAIWSLYVGMSSGLGTES